MDLGIRGKRGLVTGSTAGIGFPIAAALRREGVHLVVNGRTDARGGGGEASGTGRARRPRRWRRGGPGDARRSSGRHPSRPEVDILVNHAGIFEARPFEQIPDEGWTQLFETNVMSGVRLGRHHLPGMRARGWGRIAFIASESALNIRAEMIHYGMTKTAQLALSRRLVETKAGTG